MIYREPLIILERGAKQINIIAADQLRRQGHHLTGALEASITTHVVNTDRPEVVGTMAGYGAVVDAGVTPARIPYGKSTGATTSMYIQGLVEFWKLKGLNEKEALSAAFATAKVHKKDGMPSPGSFAYTNNGLRVDFIDQTEKATLKTEAKIGNDLDRMVDNFFNKTKSETI